MENILYFRDFIGESYLKGSRQPIYHMCTTLADAFSILDSNVMKNKLPLRLMSLKNKKSNSFARNLDFASFDGALHKPMVIFELDADKLRNDGIHFYPVDEWMGFRQSEVDMDEKGARLSRAKRVGSHHFGKSNFPAVQKGYRGSKHGLKLSTDPKLETEFEERTYQDIPNFKKYLISIGIEERRCRPDVKDSLIKYLKEYPEVRVYSFPAGNHRKQTDIDLIGSNKSQSDIMTSTLHALDLPHKQDSSPLKNW